LSTKRAVETNGVCGLRSPLALVYMNNRWPGQAVGTAQQLWMPMEER
jgi:hypothetical protein